MSLKSLSWFLVALCSSQILATPASGATTPDGTTEASQGSNAVGSAVLYSQSNYTGSYEIVGVVFRANTFCQEWTYFDTGKPLFPIKSYLGGNIACLTYGKPNCTGASNGAFGGPNDPDVTLNLKSFSCYYKDSNSS